MRAYRVSQPVRAREAVWWCLCRWCLSISVTTLRSNLAAGLPSTPGLIYLIIFALALSVEVPDSLSLPVTPFSFLLQSRPCPPNVPKIFRILILRYMYQCISHLQDQFARPVLLAPTLVAARSSVSDLPSRATTCPQTGAKGSISRHCPNPPPPPRSDTTCLCAHQSVFQSATFARAKQLNTYCREDLGTSNGVLSDLCISMLCSSRFYSTALIISAGIITASYATASPSTVASSILSCNNAFNTTATTKASTLTGSAAGASILSFPVGTESGSSLIVLLQMVVLPQMTANVAVRRLLALF